MKLNALALYKLAAFVKLENVKLYLRNVVDDERNYDKGYETQRAELFNIIQRHFASILRILDIILEFYRISYFL